MNGQSTGLLRRKMKAMAPAQVLILAALTLVPVDLSGTHGLAFAGEGSDGSSHGIGIKAASWFLTIPYGIAKVVYATTGAIVGGFAYALSGGDTEAAKAVWNSSIKGTYVIRPEHLKGQEPVRFVGKAESG